MSSNLKVNTILPSTGTTIGIGTVGGLINVVGNIDVNSTSGISTFNDLEIADKIIHSGDTNTAIRFPVGDVISAETNGVERLRITSAGTLLLGTSTGALSNGNGIVIADATAARLSLKDTTNGVTGTDGFDVVQTGTDAYLYHRENGNMIFGTNATERLRIDSSGHISQGGGATPSSTNGNVGLKFGIKSALNNVIIGETTNGSMNGIILESRITGRSGGARCSQVIMGDGVITFETAPSGGAVAERLRIDSSGQLMIGTTTPSSNSAAQVLTIANTTAQSADGNCGMTIRSGNTGGQTNQGSIFFSDATSGAGEYAGYLQYSHSASPEWFRIGVGSNPRFYVYSNGNAEISDGDLKLASGHGIDFSATANSSGANISELLDDYEEGSWTPTWYFTTANYGPNYTHQMGAYTKIGRQVTVYFSLYSTSVNGSNGGLQISGLPFADNTSPVEYPATAGAFPIFGFTGWTGEYISLQVVGSKIQLYGVVKNQSSYSPINSTEVNGGGALFLKGQVTYNV